MPLGRSLSWAPSGSAGPTLAEQPSSRASGRQADRQRVANTNSASFDFRAQLERKSRTAFGCCFWRPLAQGGRPAERRRRRENKTNKIIALVRRQADTLSPPPPPPLSRRPTARKCFQSNKQPIRFAGLKIFTRTQAERAGERERERERGSGARLAQCKCCAPTTFVASLLGRTFAASARQAHFGGPIRRAKLRSSRGPYLMGAAVGSSRRSPPPPPPPPLLAATRRRPSLVSRPPGERRLIRLCCCRRECATLAASAAATATSSAGRRAETFGPPGEQIKSAPCQVFCGPPD